MGTRSHLAVIAGIAVLACDRGVSVATARGSVARETPRVVINEIMANPRAVPDEHGEWVEVTNLDSTPVDLRGWGIASANDRGVTIDRRVMIPAGGFAVLSREGDAARNGGVT